MLTPFVDVSRPERLSSAEITSIVQAAGLQGKQWVHRINDRWKWLTMVPAVRKNRYIVLPVDFEEAWKVCCLVIFGSLSAVYTPTHFSLPLSSSKTSNVPTRPWTSVCIFISICLLLIADAVLYLRRPIVAVDCTVVCAHDVSPPGTLLTTLYRLHCILLDNIVVTSHACVSESGVFQRSTL